MREVSPQSNKPKMSHRERLLYLSGFAGGLGLDALGVVTHEPNFFEAGVAVKAVTFVIFLIRTR